MVTMVTFCCRFVHFTQLVSRGGTIDFSPLYGSLRIAEAGLYSLSYSVEAAGAGLGLDTGLYLYPGPQQDRGRVTLASCTARPGCSCSATALVSVGQF